MEVINNIHRRILNISAKFKNLKIKKSGYNKFSGFNYFELSDIQPVLIDLMLEEGVGAIYSIDEKVAEATFINLDDPKDRATFKVPMGEANLKGTQDMQNKGACITYARRYLLLLAFNIVEPDQLDAVQGDPRFKNESKNVRELPDIEAMRGEISDSLNALIKDGYILAPEIVRMFPKVKKEEIVKLSHYEVQKLYVEIKDFVKKMRSETKKKVEP